MGGRVPYRGYDLIVTNEGVKVFWRWDHIETVPTVEQARQDIDGWLWAP